MSPTQSQIKKDKEPNKLSFARKELIKGTLDLLVRCILPLVVLAAGILLTLHLMRTGPQARPEPVKSSRVVVETTTLSYSSHPTVVQAMGVVQAARFIELKPQVSGKITSISETLSPGSSFVEGEVILQLDQEDYRLILQQEENAVIEAENELELEKGNQQVAKNEYDLLGEQVSEEEKRLMLRQPQLSSLQTELSTALAKKEQAELNLARTTIRSPYNGIIQDLNVNIGAWVSSSSVIATLIGSDTYWVEVSVPEEQLQWLNVPAADGGQGSTVRVYNPSAWGDTSYREGKLIRLLPGLESEGRMARLLVEIDDPLSLKPANAAKPQVMLNSYVQVEIDGKTIAQAVELPREYLHNGEQIWVCDESDTLAIREIEIEFKNRDNVLVTGGIREGDSIITSDISTPIEGLLLKNMSYTPDGGAEQVRGGERVAKVAAGIRPERKGAEHE